jgi:hypothetical protein
MYEDMIVMTKPSDL